MNRDLISRSAFKEFLGWWEYRHFNDDEGFNNVIDEKVLAWMPMPEPYKEQK